MLCYDEVMSKICTSLLALFIFCVRLLIECLSSIFHFGLPVLGGMKHFWDFSLFAEAKNLILDGISLRFSLLPAAATAFFPLLNSRRISRLTLEPNVRSERQNRDTSMSDVNG